MKRKNLIAIGLLMAMAVVVGGCGSKDVDEDNAAVVKEDSTDIADYTVKTYDEDVGTDEIEILSDTALYEQPNIESSKLRELSVGTYLIWLGDVRTNDDEFAGWVKVSIDDVEGFVCMDYAEYAVKDAADPDFEIPEGMYGPDATLEEILADIGYVEDEDTDTDKDVSDGKVHLDMDKYNEIAEEWEKQKAEEEKERQRRAEAEANGEVIDDNPDVDPNKVYDNDNVSMVERDGEWYTQEEFYEKYGQTYAEYIEELRKSYGVR